MNAMSNALESVRVNAELYYESQDETRRNHRRLVETVKHAKESGATQQQIADVCSTDGHRLSRQRIAQLLREP